MIVSMLPSPWAAQAAEEAGGGRTPARCGACPPTRCYCQSLSRAPGPTFARPETAADLGYRLDRLNVLAVCWLAGEIVRSLRSAKPPTAALDDSERMRENAPRPVERGGPIEELGTPGLGPSPPCAALTQPLASVNLSNGIWIWRPVRN
jgi:hypothetical protein